MIDSQLVGLVSAATALVASIAGPLTTLHIGRLQIRASVLSANRQKWIDSFREAVANFCSHTAALVHLREKVVSDGRLHVSSEPEVIERFEVLVFTLARIRLLADPLDDEHSRLLALMRDQLEAMKAAPMEDDVAPRVEAMGSRIVELSVSILRKEWARVKRLD